MPRYDSDPTKVSASQEIYPAGDYEFIIKSKRVFVKKDEEGMDKNWGIAYRLEIAEGPFAGKPFTVNLYEHSEAAKPMNKAFVMNAMGYPRGRAHENRFNNDFAGKESWIDTDTNEAGDFWDLPIGQRIIGTLAIRMYNSEEQQDVKGWRPLSAA